MLRRFLAAVTMMTMAAGSAPAADLPGPIIIDEPIAATSPCADPHVLNRIADRFAWAERNTWHRGFVMASLRNGRSSNHPYFQPGLILRHYCMADSAMTNGLMPTVYYVIEVGQGLASIGNYVDFCVLGLDPWHIYDEACRTVR